MSQSEKDPKLVVFTAEGDPPGAGNTKDSESRTPSKKSCNKPDSGVLIANGVFPGTRNTMDSGSKTPSTKNSKNLCHLVPHHHHSLQKGKIGENHPKVWRIILRMYPL